LWVQAVLQMAQMAQMGTGLVSVLFHQSAAVVAVEETMLELVVALAVAAVRLP
jgi:hypothetical protein